MKVIMESVKSTSIAQTNHYYRQKSVINVAKFSWGIAPWSATATINSFPTPQTAQPEEPSQCSTVKSSPSAFKLHFLCYSLPSDTIDAIYHLKQRQINLWQQQKLAQPRPISKTKHLKKQAPCTHRRKLRHQGLHWRKKFSQEALFTMSAQRAPYSLVPLHLSSSNIGDGLRAQANHQCHPFSGIHAGRNGGVTNQCYLKECPWQPNDRIYSRHQNANRRCKGENWWVHQSHWRLTGQPFGITPDAAKTAHELVRLSTGQPPSTCKPKNCG